MTQATFNPLDIGASVALSNSNLTALSSFGGFATGVRAQDVKKVGKYYFEITANTITSAFQSAIALSKPATPLAQLTTQQNGAIVVSQSGLIEIPGNDASQSIGHFNNGDVFCIAVDLDNGKAWFRKNGGFWNAQNNIGADPATNVLGMPISFLNVAGLIPAVSFGASGDQFTANFGQSSYSFTAPSGFINWDTGATWNPSDISANVGLLNYNMTAKASAAGDKGVRATLLQTAGKLYFEVNADTIGGTDTGVGVAKPSASLATLGTNATSAAIKFKSGSIWVNGSSIVGTATAFGAGTKACVAVDFTNNKIWFRVGSGIWNNSGTADPASNVGGLDISAITSGGAGLYPAAAIQNSGDQVTANFGALPFSQTIPSGFSAWSSVSGHSPLTATNTTQLSSKSGTHYALSGGNLIATHSGTVADGIAAFDSQSKGKFYFEGISSITASSNTAIGILADNATPTKGNKGHFYINTNFAQIEDSTGTVVITGSGSPPVGTALCIAADLDAKLVWFRVGAGNWNNSGTADPTSGVGGLDLSSIGAAWRPFVCSSTDAAVWTLNFGASAFQQSVPPGFTPGWLVNDDDLQVDHTATSANTATLTHSTEGPNRILVFSAWLTGGSSNSISGISDTAGLTWHARQNHLFSNGQRFQTFWAFAPDELTGNVITPTVVGSPSQTFQIVAFKNADSIAPFDTNGSVPATNETASSVASLSVTGISSDSDIAFAILEACLFATIHEPVTSLPVSQAFTQNSATFLADGLGTQKTNEAFSSATFTAALSSGTAPINVALDIIRKTTLSEVPSSLEGFSGIIEAASSDALLEAASSDAANGENPSDERASSDHLAHEAASSDHLAHEAASSDLAAERASSDHLAHEAASSDLAVERASSDEAASSDHLAHEMVSSDTREAVSSDLAIGEAASSEFQSDVAAEPAPPIQVVTITS